MCHAMKSHNTIRDKTNSFGLCQLKLKSFLWNCCGNQILSDMRQFRDVSLIFGMQLNSSEFD